MEYRANRGCDFLAGVALFKQYEGQKKSGHSPDWFKHGEL